jgi:hypothetical protein
MEGRQQRGGSETICNGNQQFETRNQKIEILNKMMKVRNQKNN